MAADGVVRRVRVRRKVSIVKSNGGSISEISI